MNLETTTYRNHNTYGGEITLFDFEGHHTMSSMASKIASDMRFDKMCKTSYENMRRNKNYGK